MAYTPLPRLLSTTLCGRIANVKITNQTLQGSSSNPLGAKGILKKKTRKFLRDETDLLEAETSLLNILRTGPFTASEWKNGSTGKDSADPTQVLPFGFKTDLD